MVTIDLSRTFIFVVDDLASNLEVLQEILREHEFLTDGTTNSIKAVELIRQSRPDLVMLDISMPELNGYELCCLLKSFPETRDIPVIFLSGLNEALDKVAAFQSGGADYVTKPFQIPEVIARIEHQLKISRLCQELERKQKDLEVQNLELKRKNEELLRSQQRTNLVFNALSDALPGTLLDGKYQIDTKIGSGGFGAVYRATHLGLNRQVAVKVFRPLAGNDTPEGLERFRLEGISACRVNHPNAVSVLDYGVSAVGIAYLVMELLRGQTLNQELRQKGILSTQRCAEILLPVCDALTEAHTQGIIHRDIKPDNVFLHQGAEGEIVKVVDFGTAKLLYGNESEGTTMNLTEGGTLLGTPLYMSPERLQCEPYDGKADVYSVGVMAFQMLCGKPPFIFKKGEIMALIAAHVSQPPPQLRALNPAIPKEVEQLVLQSLAKKAADRPTAKEFGLEFLRALGKEFQRRTGKFQAAKSPKVIIPEHPPDQSSTVKVTPEHPPQQETSKFQIPETSLE
ncbi:MAG: protein kinase [Blastocatellia bacterium]|nr:protein kinase [Blastocatellia bacterium]